jgi:hypothetical protein
LLCFYSGPNITSAGATLQVHFMLNTGIKIYFPLWKHCQHRLGFDMQLVCKPWSCSTWVTLLYPGNPRGRLTTLPAPLESGLCNLVCSLGFTSVAITLNLLNLQKF